MASRTIKGVFQLRGDTLANWTSNDPVLKDREVGIVVVPADSASGMNEPAVLLKIGDGAKSFTQLPYVSAIAGDVKAWAKAESKPTYTADEISGLSDYIAGEIDDTDTQYKIEQDNTDGHTIKFYSKAKGTESWSLEATITTVDTTYDDTELSGRVDDVESEIDSLQELLGETSVQAQIAAAIAALDLANTYETKGEAAKVLGTESDTEDKNTVYGAKAAAAAAKTAAEAKVAGVTAGDNSIDVVNIDPKNPQIKVKIDPDNTNALKMGDNGLKVTIPDASVVTVIEKSAPNTGYLKTYQVTVDGVPVGVDIDIPKDFLVKSASTSVVADTDKNTGGKFADNADFAVGDKYIDFTINVKSGDADTDEHVYLNVKDLAHVYTAGQGIAISNADVISVKVDTANANGLALTDAGLKLNLATPSADGEGGTAGALSAADKEKLDSVTAGATKVEKSDVNGNVKINDAETQVYALPATVLDATDTFVFDGGNAAGNA